jgi:quercetin dioxygenase-like cupin family protein
MKRTIVNPLIQDTVTFLKTAEETGGAESELLLTLRPGGKNALHYHKAFSETFTALDGELGLQFAKHKTKVLQPGESFTAEPLTPHGFFNPTDREIKFHIRIAPGHTGFEEALRIAYGLAEDGLTNQDGIPRKISHMAILVSLSDTNLPGIFSFFAPILKIMAARAQGEATKLREKYCI